MSMTYKTGCWNFLLIAMLVYGTVSPAAAVVLSTGDGAGNTVAPEADFGFANVGVRGAGSAIYLGNRWVMTASHLGAGPVTFGDTAYSNVIDQTFRVSDPDTDILLLRLHEDPGLPAVHLGCSPVRANSEVILAGAGRDREVEPTFWSVETVIGDNNDIWAETTQANSDRMGYKTTGNRTPRWGWNLVSRTNLVTSSGSGDVQSFQTLFQPFLPVEDHAQGVRGDSGGAVFQENEGVWELVGMMHAINLHDSQPDRTNTAIVGNSTFIADLDFYADKIRAIADFEPEIGDADGDGEFTATDIDMVFASARDLSLDSCHYDLTGDGRVWRDDVELLLERAGTLFGDADLNGEVDFSDFLAVSRSFGSPDKGWADGDFDGDREVTFGDFLIVSQNFGRIFEPQAALSTSVTAIPEPGGLHLVGVGLTLFLLARRRRRS